ncbi:hypothetical protein C7B67_23210, partial [filamentous cyanobacterium Phorm 6]
TNSNQKVCSEDFSPQKRRTEVLTTNSNQKVCSEDFSPQKRRTEVLTTNQFYCSRSTKQDIILNS